MKESLNKVVIADGRERKRTTDQPDATLMQKLHGECYSKLKDDDLSGVVLHYYLSRRYEFSTDEIDELFQTADLPATTIKVGA